uniref:Sphingosine kinase 1 n=1 Tax=Labrus bergylta TaxID=56723 RepID=A0A3Q3EY66_9LABR
CFYDYTVRSQLPRCYITLPLKPRPTSSPRNMKCTLHSYLEEDFFICVSSAGEAECFILEEITREHTGGRRRVTQDLLKFRLTDSSEVKKRRRKQSEASAVVTEELLLSCGFLLCKGLVSRMDLVSVQLSSGPRLFSFLSLAWGFVADVDIESEKYRHVGAARFTVGTLVRLASLRVYRGRLAYLPSTPSRSPHKAPRGPPDSLLPPLDQQLPGDWVLVQEEDFVLMLAMYHSHLAEDLLAAPGAAPDDGVIHLFYVRAGISRAALLKLFLAMEKGEHLGTICQHLVYVKVRALRLEPFSPKGIITLDGEVVEYGPLQAEVHRGLARLITG